jgi:polyhydroxyalkanoate synthase
MRLQDLVSTVRQVGRKALTHPRHAIEKETALVRELAAIAVGRSKIEVPPGDRRFADPAWTENPLYRRTLQAYLACGQALDAFIAQSGLEPKTRERARYYAATTNALIGNPAALKLALETGGRSIVRGLANQISDARHNGLMPAQVDRSAFALGKNLALSPGAVVFRNEVLELIQFEPRTAEVRSRPHLIVPPQINKFYVFDLAPGKSIVEHLVSNGFQVFAVSWRNPTCKHRDWDMDTYVSALLKAIAGVCEIAGSDDVIAHAACSGAMTTAALMGYLARRRDRRIYAATMMVAVLGGAGDSLLGLFATPRAIAAAKQASARQGVLKGEDMGRVFAWLRPDDLIWNYWVNNYLMGRKPPAFDVLYWNNDTTRLPATFHAQLLDIFGDDLLRQPDAFEVLGTPVDLQEVKCDKYFVAGTTDHITPWKGVYESARSFGGRNRFILSTSGHIQSLINPPGNPKSSFLSHTKMPASADRWLSAAQSTPGSWWNDWAEWLGERSGTWRAAPASLGGARHPASEPAPGTYVLER